jgi:hypothetical protein
MSPGVAALDVVTLGRPEEFQHERPEPAFDLAGCAGCACGCAVLGVAVAMVVPVVDCPATIKPPRVMGKD